MGKEQARLFQAYTKSLRQSTGSGRAHQVFVGSEQAAQQGERIRQGEGKVGDEFRNSGNSRSLQKIE